jgi:ribosomal protein S10
MATNQNIRIRLKAFDYTAIDWMAARGRSLNTAKRTVRDRAGPDALCRLA